MSNLLVGSELLIFGEQLTNIKRKDSIDSFMLKVLPKGKIETSIMIIF